MIKPDALIDLLALDGLTRGEKLMLCMAVEVGRSKPVKEITALAHDHGLRAVRGWNVSAILGKTPTVVRGKQGWLLTSPGRDHVAALLSARSSENPRVANSTQSLRKHAAAIKNPDAAAFVQEAIACFGAGFLRAAVVLSWVGAVAVLYETVVSGHLKAFNAEAKRRNAKWKPAKTSDDLARMKEMDFLQILDRISVLGKSVRQELENSLTLRNGCGHPNSLKITENRVAAHIDVLVVNVFSKFV